ncbi:MAG: hypothetical protein WCC59_14305 [Terriglobales bacterium]
MANLFKALFGCGHKRTTFPMTIKTGQGSLSPDITETYVVCLDCGKEFAYDWQEMKLVSVSHATGQVR